jgi:TonB family protein
VAERSFRARMHKEFGRPVLRNWDWQFTFILGITLVFEVVIINVMARRPTEEYSQAEIARIQEQFANFIMAEEDREITRTAEIVSTGETAAQPETEEIEEPAPAESYEAERTPPRSEGRGGEAGGEGGPSGIQEIQRESRQAQAEARRQSREAVSRSVSSKGLLGLLTGTGNTTTGDAVQDVLGGGINGNRGNRDLDEILSSVDGLQTRGGSGLGGVGGAGSDIGNVRGSRSGRQASIDDLVSERSNLATASMSRQGDLVVENPSDVVGGGNKSAYRSPEAIREILLGHVPAIRYCYERELKRDPELKGKLSVRITVSAEGHVTAAEVISSSLNTRVNRCILARIRLWKDFRPIDRTEGSITFRQVYTFGI